MKSYIQLVVNGKDIRLPEFYSSSVKLNELRRSPQLCDVKEIMEVARLGDRNHFCAFTFPTNIELESLKPLYHKTPSETVG